MLLAVLATLMWAQFGTPTDAHAWKPQPPYCQYNCGVPVGEISAQPKTVYIQSPSVTGSTTLRWKWDWVGPHYFQLLCVYVRVNNDAHASKVTCEWPGNTTHTTIPWIVTNNLYTFTLYRDIGNVVPVAALQPGQVGYTNGKQISVDVVGVSR